MEKLSINLLQAELIPKQPLLTLKRVVMLWFCSLLAVCFVWWLSSSQHEQNLQQFKQLSAQQKVLDKKQKSLEKRINKNKVDSRLEEKHEILVLSLKNKKSLHRQLTDNTSVYTAGFSNAMTELAELHHNDISLQKIKLNGSEMMFSGLARSPEAVPSWLAAFEQATFLSGKTFNHFNLGENEDSVTTFAVSTSYENKQGER